MFVGSGLCIWTLVMEQLSGIYLELVFIDAFLNFGQSFFTFALFGIDSKGTLIGFKNYIHTAFNWQTQLKVVPWEELDITTKAVCTMFSKHHLDVCKKQLLLDEYTQRQNSGKKLVVGSDLVTWLVERGLVLSRQDGEKFGKHLLKGRILMHVENKLDFYDGNYLYIFI